LAGRFSGPPRFFLLSVFCVFGARPLLTRPNSYKFGYAED
jgi:hypothetical protein